MVYGRKQTDIHTHATCNAVTLVWGSLRLAPITGMHLPRITLPATTARVLLKSMRLVQKSCLDIALFTKSFDVGVRVQYLDIALSHPLRRL